MGIATCQHTNAVCGGGGLYEYQSHSPVVQESAGKRQGYSGKKIGNAHLKWAFSEAAVLFLKNNPAGMKFKKRLEKKHGKSKALSILAHKIGRAVYFMLKRGKAFNMDLFLEGECQA